MKNLFVCLTVLKCLILSGCGHEISVHGYNFASAKPEVLEVGKSTSNDVLNVMGTPSAQMEFGSKKFSYISTKMSQSGVFASKILEQNVLSIDFDKNDIVSAIRYYNLDDANNIIVAREFTEIKGNTLTPVQQILTNIGKYRKK